MLTLTVKDKHHFRWIITEPTGFENNCEDEENTTKWYVLHAEANAIMKVTASTQSCDGATRMLCIISPCRECSKLIFNLE